jgi:lipopolysaccharide biosynthesis regulator YciM
MSNKGQIALIVGGVALVAALYFGVNNMPAPKKAEAPAANRDGGGTATQEQAAPQPMADFAEIEAKGKNKLSEAQQKSLAGLVGEKNELAKNKALVKFWAEAKQPLIAAKYNAMAAELENTEKSRTFAAQFFIDLFNHEQEPKVRTWAASEASKLLEKVVSTNPNNEQAKIALATCYTDGTGETMKGVLMLREVAQKNPSSLDAGLLLGKLAIQSGQFDKAADRLAKLAELHPKEAEVLYYLGIAYKNLGKIEEAKQTLQKSKTLVKDAKFGKQIDEFVKTF